MDTTHILCTLKDVPSFLGVCPSDILPSPSVTRSATLIVNTDPHTANRTHCLAIHLQPRSYSVYFFDYYVCPLSSLIPWLVYAVRELSGNTTPRSCRAWPVQSAANIAVYSRYTWTACTLLNILWASSMPRQPTYTSNAYSHRNSNRYAHHLAGVWAALLLHL